MPESTARGQSNENWQNRGVGRNKYFTLRCHSVSLTNLDLEADIIADLCCQGGHCSHLTTISFTNSHMRALHTYVAAITAACCALFLLLSLCDLPHSLWPFTAARVSRLARNYRIGFRKLNDDLSNGFIVGLTTVSRPNATYLNGTLHSLRCALATDYAQPAVLVLNGDVHPTRHAEFEELWHQPSIRHWFRHGLLLISPGTLHPELQAAQAAGGIPPTHGDPPARMWWRSKEILDKAYLIEAAMNVSEGARYFIMMEDDIQIAPKFLSKLAKFIDRRLNRKEAVDVVSLYGDAAHMGGVGLAYKVDFLRKFVRYLREHYSLSPYDWALNNFERDHNLKVHLMIPNLVQHVGTRSSLIGKTQSLQSASFEAAASC